ncbi:MAG: FliM/FliN family flagellar motor C-terminal domain-containing protein [Paracoccaceae bacterium]
MLKVATEAPIESDTVVQRMNLSIGRILAMKRGDMLELIDGSLGALVVEGQTANGPKVVFNGHLGALNSHKAFKVTSTTDLDY